MPKKDDMTLPKDKQDGIADGPNPLDTLIVQRRGMFGSIFAVRFVNCAEEKTLICMISFL